MAFVPNEFDPISTEQLPLANPLSTTDARYVSQTVGSTQSCGRVTLGTEADFFWQNPAAPVSLSSNTTLTTAAHQNLDLFVTTSLTLTVPSAGTLGVKFRCCIYAAPGATVTLSGTVVDLGGNAVTTIAPSHGSELKVMGGIVYSLPFNQAAAGGSSGQAATAYTLGISPTSLSPGSTVTITATPNGFWPTGAAGTAVTTGVSGTLSSPTHATLSGSTLTFLAGNAAVTAVFTPTGSGSGTFDLTIPGLSDTSGPQSFTVSGGAPSSYPSLTITSPSWETVNQKFGTGALKGGTATASITPVASTTYGAPNADLCVAFWFKSGDTANWSNAGQFLNVGYHGLKGTSGAKTIELPGQGPATVNIRDGAWHYIVYRVAGAFGYSYAQIYIDGSASGPSFDGFGQVLSAGTPATVQFTFTYLNVGDIIDDIELTNSSGPRSMPTAAAVRDSLTNVIWHLDGNGNGV
jgi:hypothetical protein